MLQIRRIYGTSMQPNLTHGQFVAFARIGKFNVGDVVLCKIDNMDSIKRIVKLRTDGVWVEGDNKPGSTDSRDFGWISRLAIKSKLVYPFMK